MTYHLKLKPEPDGFGYIYGELRIGDVHYTVNIMPPVAEWRGQLKMDGDGAPHETDWVIIVDGEEIARVRKRADIESALAKRFIEGPR